SCTYSYCARQTRPSFPTRRSSDLVGGGNAAALGHQIADLVGALLGRAVDIVPEIAGHLGRHDRAMPAIGTGEGLRQLHVLKPVRSEEHTSELQSRENLVCRLLLEK